jgi:hypothetical protein
VLKGNTLIVLGEDSGKLSFTKTYFVAEKEDLFYYIIACNKLMQPAENWRVTIHSESSNLKLDEVPEFDFHHSLELAELRTLIAAHVT